RCRVRAMRISELADRSGVPARTVRFYADNRLILPTARSEGGYRVFDDRALRELRFVRRGQRLGLSLAEIKPLLKAAEQGEPSKLLRAKLTKQLDVVNERIAELSAVRHELQALVTSTEGPCRDELCLCKTVVRRGPT
ncbi:MAG TPA: MerR family transcriptional regulator, partial [Candidatus Limnocylindria bacterium]